MCIISTNAGITAGTYGFMIKNLLIYLLLTLSSTVYSAQSILEARIMTISMGGYPNFLYQIPYEEQVYNVVSDLLKPLSIKITVEYRPWRNIPKIINELNHATVAPIGISSSIPTGFIYSIPFSIAASQSIVLILKDTEDNKKFMVTFNYQLRSKMK